MKTILLITAFLCFSLASFAQYGKLEPLGNVDSMYVLRTPYETIKKLKESDNKIERNKGEYIKIIESQLELARNGYFSKRLPTLNVQSFISGIKYLENNGVDVNYYVQEYFFYYPKRGSRN